MNPHRSARLACLLPALGVLSAFSLRGATDLPEAEVFAFTDRHCSSCHNDVDKEGGLDLTELKYSPSDPANFLVWVKIHDRVAAGEMPPKEKSPPAKPALNSFLKSVDAALTASDRELIAREGRATQRRLNRTEYEAVLRDLLQAPWLLVQNQLPEDGEAHGFNKVSRALDVSYVHMERYMAAADYSMREVLSAHFGKTKPTAKRYYAREQPSMTRRIFNTVFAPGPDRSLFPVLGTQPQPDVREKSAPMTVGDTDPEMREQEAVGTMSSEYEGFGYSFDQFHAPTTGRYRVRFSGYTIWFGTGGRRRIFAKGSDPAGTWGPPVWYSANGNEISEGRRDESITVYTKAGPVNRRVGSFDVTTEPTVSDLGVIWLNANETLSPNATRFFRSRPTPARGYTNPLMQRDGTPGVAFKWMEVEGPLEDEPADAGYALLFGDLPLKKAAVGAPGVQVQAGARGRAQGAGRGSSLAKVTVEVESSDPRRDAERLLRAFMTRAYRRPIVEEDVAVFAAFINKRLEAGLGFAGAMLAGYAAVLSSPEFVYLDEPPGALADHALATRLALFLWNSEPDAALRAKADRNELHRPEVLKAETERLLNSPKSRRFTDAFLDYWIDLRKSNDTTPASTLYNDYTLDDSLYEAAEDETRLYFADMVRSNLPARNIVDSDFTYLNERLAVHYGIPDVSGVAMRRVKLPADSPRGGLMTQASVLKVTANGTTTSPVIRGKWIMERVLGFTMPPPPAAVPAVEPDIRGAVTIRQQLDKHRADESCAICHRKIDPAGFALENFDVMGAWRTQYRANSTTAEVPNEVGFGKDGWPFMFHLALPVDAAGQLPDGRAFRDVKDFKRLLLQDEEQIARNLVRQLSIFATGAPVSFSDRSTIEQILRRTAPAGYGVRSMIHEIVQSDLFLKK